MIVSYYDSPIGTLELSFKDEKLCGLTITNVCSDNDSLPNLPYIIEVKNWLNKYFKGEVVNIDEIPLLIEGTDFQKVVWRVLMDIPYGEVVSYKSIAKKVAILMGKNSMSCQAVGTAVGKNKIAIIIPCHRVIGSNEKLGGYSLGIDKKISLLELEGIDTSKLKNS